MTKFREHATEKAARDEAKAIDKALGNPRPPSHVGANIAKHIASAYARGAVGWTETECEIQVHEDGTALLHLSEKALELGKRDVVVDGKLVKLDLTDALSDRPEKFRPPIVDDVDDVDDKDKIK